MWGKQRVYKNLRQNRAESTLQMNFLFANKNAYNITKTKNQQNERKRPTLIVSWIEGKCNITCTQSR